MATAMPWPWCGPSARMRRTSRSSVPWRRESRAGGSFLVDILPEYCALLVECQLESHYTMASTDLATPDRHETTEVLILPATNADHDPSQHVFVLDSPMRIRSMRERVLPGDRHAQSRTLGGPR